MPIEVQYGMDPAAIAALALISGMGQRQLPQVPQFDTSLPSPDGGGGGGGGGRVYRSPLLSFAPTGGGAWQPSRADLEREAIQRLPGVIANQQSIAGLQEQNRLQRQKILEEEKAKAQQQEREYSAKQKQELARATMLKQNVDRNPGFSPAEKEIAKNAIDVNALGIRNNPAVESFGRKYLPGKGPGDDWIDEVTGDHIAMDIEGNKRVLVRYDQSREGIEAKRRAAREEKEIELQTKREDNFQRFRADLITSTVDSIDPDTGKTTKRPRNAQEIADGLRAYLGGGADYSSGAVATPDQLQYGPTGIPAGLPQRPIIDLQRQDEQRIITIRNDAERDALPSGTIYIGPDGKRRRKS